MPGCTVPWVGTALWSIRFVDHWGTGEAPPFIDGAINVNRDRIMVFLYSSSAPVTCVCAGATVEVLEEIDSSSPANFGGDGHIWYGIYYVTPTADPIDFTGTTGVNRHALFMRAGQDIIDAQCTYTSDLEYNGSMFGHANEIAIADQEARLNDLVGLFINDVVRSIDDIHINKSFFNSDPSFFDNSWSFHNAEPVPFEPGGGAQSSIDWCQSAPGGDSNFSIAQEVDAVATDFPGACRVLSFAASYRVRALCQVIEVEP